MTRTPQTPEDMKRTGIIFIIFAAVILVVGIGATVSSARTRAQCTAYVSGVIREVNSKDVRTKKHRGYRTHTEYQAVVSLETHSQLGVTEMTSGWTRKHYREGDFIKVYYDPADPAVYYMEGNEPENGIGMIVFSLIFGAVGFILCKRGIDERRQIWDAGNV